MVHVILGVLTAPQPNDADSHGPMDHPKEGLKWPKVNFSLPCVPLPPRPCVHSCRASGSQRTVPAPYACTAGPKLQLETPTPKSSARSPGRKASSRCQRSGNPLSGSRTGLVRAVPTTIHCRSPPRDPPGSVRYCRYAPARARPPDADGRARQSRGRPAAAGDPIIGRCLAAALPPAPASTSRILLNGSRAGSRRRGSRAGSSGRRLRRPAARCRRRASGSPRSWPAQAGSRRRAGAQAPGR